MRQLAFLLILISALGTEAIAQVHEMNNYKRSHPDRALEKTTLLDDSLTSSFVIWINKEVKPHYHEWHTEQVWVEEGSGTILLGDSLYAIGPGSFVTIPKGTVHAVKVNSDSAMKVISIQSPRYMGMDRVWVKRERSVKTK